MTNIIHITSADELSVSNNQLVIPSLEGSDTKIALSDILALVLENCQCRISAVLQLRLAESHIPLIICNEKHQPVLHTLPLFEHFHLTERLKEQIAWTSNQKDMLWRQIVKHKIEHQKQLLEYLDVPDSVCERLANYINELDNSAALPDQQEAIAARVYFQRLFGSSFTRGAESGTNSVLNYGYMVLRALICAKIVAWGFHPSLGINHSSQFNSYNLADDIIEVFRPMVDYLAYYHQEQISILDKEMRQKILLVLTQTVFWKNKPYVLSQALDNYMESIRNYFLSGSNVDFPELRIKSYEY